MTQLKKIMIDAKTPAFPLRNIKGDIFWGLTKRELFSVLILGGLVYPDGGNVDALEMNDNSVKNAIRLADKLIEGLND